MPAKKRRIEIVSLLGGILILLMIILWYGKTWIQYIVGFLGVIYFVFSWAKRGITPTSFNSIIALVRFQRWDKIDYVEVYYKNNHDFKVSYLNTYLGKDSYYYKYEDYDKVINILSDKLPSKKIRIK